MKKLIALTAMFLVLGNHAAEAKVWKVDYVASKLAFSGTQTNTPFTGTFGAYEAKIDLDPALIEQAKIDVNIDMASAKTGDVQRDQALPGSDWFDVKAFPKANFHVTSVEKLQPSSDKIQWYLANGDLTIKGITKKGTLSFKLTPYKNGLRAQGTLAIDRADYKVGVGEWASDAIVGRAVAVNLDLIAE